MKDRESIVITGCCGLLGKQLSQSLSEQYHIIGIDIFETCDVDLKNFTYLRFNLLDIDKYDILVDKIKSSTSNLMGLINNAAFNPKIEGDTKSFGKFEDLDLDSWNQELSLNLSSPIFLIQKLLPFFNTESGNNCKIVNIVSTYGLVPPNQSIYKALSEKTGVDIVKPIAYPVSKAALVMVTKYLSTYLGDANFNVNGVAPGGIENGQDKLFVDEYVKLVPMRRMAKVEDMVGVVELLVSSKSDYINGQIIPVDGGWTTW